MIVNDYVATLSCKVSRDSIDMYRKLYATLEEKQETDALKIYDELVENIQFHS